MSSWSLSMRWWLGLAFAAVAAATAIAVAQGLVQRSEAAFREDAAAPRLIRFPALRPTR